MLSRCSSGECNLAVWAGRSLIHTDLNIIGLHTVHVAVLSADIDLQFSIRFAFSNVVPRLRKGQVQRSVVASLALFRFLEPLSCASDALRVSLPIIFQREKSFGIQTPLCTFRHRSSAGAYLTLSRSNVLQRTPPNRQWLRILNVQTGMTSGSLISSSCTRGWSFLRLPV